MSGFTFRRIPIFAAHFFGMMRHKVRKVFSYLLFALYLFCLQNSVFNMHVHVLKDGAVERHAHPFTTGHPAKHHHSQQDFKLLHASGLDFTDTSVQPVSDTAFQVIGQLSFQLETVLEIRDLVASGLRGPPFC